MSPGDIVMRRVGQWRRRVDRRFTLYCIIAPSRKSSGLGEIQYQILSG
jgi:hypothetical protein